MASNSKRRSSGSELLNDLEAFNQYLSQPPISSRNASLTLPSSNPSPNPRRLSLFLSPWQQSQAKDQFFAAPQNPNPSLPTEQKRGIRNWKPIRMLTHIGMRRISCLFSVELIAIRNLPESMNGLRLSINIRKKDSRDGAVRPMPSRVYEGSARFEETLFIQCNVHCSGGAATGKPIKLEPRPFLISVVVVDAPELELGRSIVDLSQLIRESIDGSLVGARIRMWDAALNLVGKAEGGQLALKLGFQIMDDGGVGIYSRMVETGSVRTEGQSRQSKNSFSISTLDSRVHKMAIFEQSEVNKFDFSELSNEAEKASASSEVVKEVVHKQVEKQFRLMELDSIAAEIRDLELMMSKNFIATTSTTEREGKKDLDASEEIVTREFLQMLDAEAKDNKLEVGMFVEKDANQESKVLLPDLGNGLGPVIQTKDGGFMVSMNPFNVEVLRKEAPKLALQISKPFVLHDQKYANGLEVFQRLAAVGLEELCSKLILLADMDELLGKTAEQIAFEGIASAIISGRNKEGASSIAAKSIAAVKRIISAMNEGKKGRNLHEIWSVKEDSIVLEDILAFSMQRMEGMALEALKVQADMAEEEASFDVSPLAGTYNPSQILDSAISLDEWEKTCEENKRLTLLMIIQSRDPVRQYEAVGAPVLAVTQAIRANDDAEDEEIGYKVISLHVGGLKVRSGEKRNTWDGEKSKLTATQWLVTNGMGNLGKKSRTRKSKLQQDLLWSFSSRIMADMWLRPVRNPDVKIVKQ